MKIIIDGADTSKEPGNQLSRDRYSSLSKQLERFLVVGLLSVATDFATYGLLRSCCGVGLAKGIAYLTGMFVGFAGNKWWTFEVRENPPSQPIKYLSLYAFTFLLNIGVNDLVLRLLGDQRLILAFLVATGVTTITNFAGMRYWVFCKPSESTVHPRTN